MRHAGDKELDQIEDLLNKIRARKSLKEKKRGVFYKGSSAFLHFHEDSSKLFADLKIGKDWILIPIMTRKEQNAFLKEIEKLVE